MNDALVEAWRESERMNQYILRSLTPEQWEVRLDKGKSVRAQFAHVHNARRGWLKHCAPDLVAGLETADGKHASKDEVAAHLAQSAEAVAKLIARAGTPDAKIPGFRPNIASFVAYHIGHEGGHRSQVEIALRQAGLPLDRKVEYGMWGEGRRRG